MALHTASTETPLLEPSAGPHAGPQDAASSEGVPPASVEQPHEDLRRQEEPQPVSTNPITDSTNQATALAMLAEDPRRPGLLDVYPTIHTIVPPGGTNEGDKIKYVQEHVVFNESLLAVTVRWALNICGSAKFDSLVPDHTVRDKSELVSKGVPYRRCTNCRQWGHDRRNCLFPRKDEIGVILEFQRQCGRCHSTGHDRRTCPSFPYVNPSKKSSPKSKPKKRERPSTAKPKTLKRTEKTSKKTVEHPDQPSHLLLEGETPSDEGESSVPPSAMTPTDWNMGNVETSRSEAAVVAAEAVNTQAVASLRKSLGERVQKRDSSALTRDEEAQCVECGLTYSTYPMLSCHRCGSSVHQECTAVSCAPIFWGDTCYTFKCSRCGPKEKLSRHQMDWEDVVFVAMLNLIISNKRDQFEFTIDELCSFIETHWESLCPLRDSNEGWQVNAEASLRDGSFTLVTQGGEEMYGLDPFVLNASAKLPSRIYKIVGRAVAHTLSCLKSSTLVTGHTSSNRRAPSSHALLKPQHMSTKRRLINKDNEEDESNLSDEGPDKIGPPISQKKKRTKKILASASSHHRKSSTGSQILPSRKSTPTRKTSRVTNADDDEEYSYSSDEGSTNHSERTYSSVSRRKSSSAKKPVPVPHDSEDTRQDAEPGDPVWAQLPEPVGWWPCLLKSVNRLVNRSNSSSYSVLELGTQRRATHVVSDVHNLRSLHDFIVGNPAITGRPHFDDALRAATEILEGRANLNEYDEVLSDCNPGDIQPEQNSSVKTSTNKSPRRTRGKRSKGTDEDKDDRDKLSMLSKVAECVACISATEDPRKELQKAIAQLKEGLQVQPEDETAQLQASLSSLIDDMSIDDAEATILAMLHEKKHSETHSNESCRRVSEGERLSICTQGKWSIGEVKGFKAGPRGSGRGKHLIQFKANKPPTWIDLSTVNWKPVSLSSKEKKRKGAGFEAEDQTVRSDSNAGEDGIMSRPKRRSKAAKTSHENVFQVQKILNKRVKDGRVEYLVKWADYSDAYNTWEPETHILSNQLIEQYEQSVKQAVKQSGKHR